MSYYISYDGVQLYFSVSYYISYDGVQLYWLSGKGMQVYTRMFSCVYVSYYTHYLELVDVVGSIGNGSLYS